MTEARWYAVVLSWNGRDHTLACLDSLARISDPPIRIVCADNGSTDGSVEAIRERHPSVHLIENGANLGFSGGNNVGLRWALDQGAQWMVLVNNDAVVAEDAFAGFAGVAAEHPGAGALAGKVYLADPRTASGSPASATSPGSATPAGPEGWAGGMPLATGEWSRPTGRRGR